jgi:hypothetical protein
VADTVTRRGPNLHELRGPNLHEGRHRRKVEPGHNRLRVRRAGHTDPAFSHGAGSGFDVPPRTRRSLVAATCADVRQGKVCAEATHGPRHAPDPQGAGRRLDSDGTTGPPGPQGSPGVPGRELSLGRARLTLICFSKDAPSRRSVEALTRSPAFEGLRGNLEAAPSDHPPANAKDVHVAPALKGSDEYVRRSPADKRALEAAVVPSSATAPHIKAEDRRLRRRGCVTPKPQHYTGASKPAADRPPDGGISARRLLHTHRSSGPFESHGMSGQVATTYATPSQNPVIATRTRGFGATPRVPAGSGRCGSARQRQRR